ncbi:hypothetical protein OF83DRAFT_1176527 [Amylostereum chailletii]|nr:hypothetical protein OF83DRAFT_1176527 [Amylostereum chailletii]
MQIRQALQEAFATRVKSLIKKYHDKTDKAHHQREARKDALFHRHRQAVQGFEALRKDQSALDVLGPAGMSADESELDGILDVVYDLCQRDYNIKKDRRGQPPHRREFSDRIDRKSPAVPGLPKNFYDKQWLASRSPEWVKDVLQPKAPVQVAASSIEVAQLIAALSTMVGGASNDTRAV